MKPTIISLAGLGALVFALGGCSSASSPSAQGHGTASASPGAGAGSPRPSTSPAASSGSVTASPPPSSPSLSSPEDVVRGVIQTELSGDYTKLCNYFEPSTRATCEKDVAAFKSVKITGHATVAGADVVGNHALVEVTGRMCFLSSECEQTTSPDSGMPASSAEFAAIYRRLSTGTTTGSALGPVPCEELSGTWYVSSTSAG